MSGKVLVAALGRVLASVRDGILTKDALKKEGTL